MALARSKILYYNVWCGRRSSQKRLAPGDLPKQNRRLDAKEEELPISNDNDEATPEGLFKLASGNYLSEGYQLVYEYCCLANVPIHWSKNSERLGNAAQLKSEYNIAS
jgi:hypothetical protein